MTYFQKRIYRRGELFLRPIVLIVSIFSIITSLYFLDIFIDIAYGSHYLLNKFNIKSVVILWIVSALSLVIFISIFCVLLYITFNLINVVKYKTLKFFSVRDFCDYTSLQLKPTYLYLFFIYIAFGTLFLFTDLPLKYALDFKIHRSAGTSEQQQLYKNEDLSKIQVQSIQRHLADYGYDIVIDGIYGPKTQNKAMDYLQKVDFEISDENQDYAGMYVLMTDDVSDFLYELQQMSKNNKEDLE